MPTWQKWVKMCGAVPITPQSVSGLIYWGRADHMLNGAGVAPADGDAIATVTELSGSGLFSDATQATAARRPIYKAAIMNGQPVLRGDGTFKYLQGTSTWNNYTKCTLAVVSQQNNAAANQGFFDTTTNGNTNTAAMLLQQTNRIFRGVGTTEFGGAGYTFNSTTKVLQFGRNDGAGAGAGTIKIYEKDVEKASSVRSSLNLSVINYRLMCLFQDVFFVNGDVAEWCLWDHALSVADLTFLGNGYFIPRYGL